MIARKFLNDLERKPEVLARFAESLSHSPWADIATAPIERVLFLGMGSSAYAADVAAARLRAAGIVAVSEIASTDVLPAWGRGTLVVAISASGTSKETLWALQQLEPGSTVVALTNTADSVITEYAEHIVLMRAEAETGGVACRTFQHTLALLLAFESHLLDRPLDRLQRTIDGTAEATAQLLSTRSEWLPQVSASVLGPAGTHVVAPARRLSSARQSALMLREGPRLAAVGCEAGDWAHVDVYLTKNTDYRILNFAGSRWDDGITEWTLPRATPVVSVGGEFEGARFVLRYPHDDVDDVRLLTETIIGELVAADAWLNQG